MKDLKNYIKNNRLVLRHVLRSFSVGGSFSEVGLLKLVVLCVVVTSANVLGNYFLYENGTDKGIWVDKDVIKENCEALKEMIADFGGTEEVNIPIGEYPIAVIQLGFDVLTNKVDVSNLSFENLVNVANIFNFLGVPVDKMKTVLDKILENLNKVTDEELKKLNPDIQKLLMIDSSINYLKDCIIKKYAQERKQVLVGHRDTVLSVAISPDGKRIVSGCDDSNNNLILWDMSDPNNITHQVLVGHPNRVNSVVFSGDGKKMVSGCSGVQNNLIIWDITDSNNVTHQVVMGHPGDINAVAISFDGTKMVSGGKGLFLWNITDLSNITRRELVGHPRDVYSVALSYDGKRMGSGCYSSQNNLIVWDVSDRNNIVKQVLIGHPSNVAAVALSSDGTKMVSGCWGTKDNLIVWDINNLNNIIKRVLVGHPNSVSAIAISSDSKRMASGCWGIRDNLILWDISNPNNMTHQVLVGHLADVMSVSLSSDGKKMASGSYGNQNNLIVWILLTDQEKSVLKQLIDCNADQIRFIYRLCQRSLKDKVIVLSSEEQAVFTVLPQDMQNLLTDLIFK